MNPWLSSGSIILAMVGVISLAVRAIVILVKGVIQNQQTLATMLQNHMTHDETTLTQIVPPLWELVWHDGNTPLVSTSKDGITWAPVIKAVPVATIDSTGR